MAPSIKEVLKLPEMILIHTKDFPNIAYRKFGNGPALVLLHGFPENGGIWNTIWPALAVNYTVIVPDIPGSGQSSLGNGDISMDSLARGINAVMDNEGIEKAVIAGHSMGGYMALSIAEQYPSKVKGLSLIYSTAAADTEEKKENRHKAIELIKKGGKEAFLKSAIPNMFSDSYKKDNPDVIREQIRRGMQLPDESMIAYYNAMANRPDRQNVLENAKFPFQLILGEKDNVISFSNTITQSRLSNCNFVSLMQDCGHMGMIEAPDKLKFNIEEFVSYCYYY